MSLKTDNFKLYKYEDNDSKEVIIANTDKSVQFKFSRNQNPGVKRIIYVLERNS